MQYKVKHIRIKGKIRLVIRTTTFVRRGVNARSHIRELRPITAKVIPIYIKNNLALSRISTPSPGKKLSAVKCLATKDGVKKKLKKIATTPENNINRTKTFKFGLLKL
jgi:hypothetical protein